MGQSWGQSHFPHSKLLPDVTVPTLCSSTEWLFFPLITLFLLPTPPSHSFHTCLSSLFQVHGLFFHSLLSKTCIYMYIHTHTTCSAHMLVTCMSDHFQGWPFCRLGNIFCSWSFSFSCFSFCSRPDVPAVSWCWLPSFILLANLNLIPTITWRSLIQLTNAKCEACMCQYRVWHGNRHEWQGFPSLIKQYTLKDPSQLGSIRTWVLTLV